VPFDADNFMGILTQHMYKAPVPIRALVPEPPDVPPGLEAIILKCLSKRPEQRYPSMDDLAGDLSRLKHGEIPEAVAEMMNRSAGFSVPHDYFKNTGAMPAPVPATPPSRGKPRWPVFAALAGVAVAALVVALRAASPTPIQAEPVKSLGEATPTTSETEKKRSEQEGIAEEELAVVRQVVLAVEPIDAKVFAGDQDLGTIPVFVDVEDGKTVSVDVKRDGYVTQTLKLDGSEGRLSIKLIEEKAASQAPRKPPRTPAPKAPLKAAPKNKKPSMGGGEIINPWG
jgi:serine/threonine-protein kinase